MSKIVVLIIIVLFLGIAAPACVGEVPPEVLPPQDYPSMPIANLDVENAVSMATLENVADAHAFELWGEDIARGQSFPVADATGDVFAYVFPYIRGSTHFPEYAEIFDEIRQLRLNYQEISEGDGQPNSIEMPAEFYNELRQQWANSARYMYQQGARTFQSLEPRISSIHISWSETWPRKKPCATLIVRKPD